MSFFTEMLFSRISKDNQLLKLDQLIDWKPIRELLSKVYKNRMSPIAGVKPYDPLSMFKALVLQSWHSLSDPDLEEALRVRFDFIIFTGFEVEEAIPDETTLCRFRNRLVAENLDRKLFEEINRQLAIKGLKVKASQGAVIDATIVESAAHPQKQIEEISVDREEKPDPVFRVQESCDPDARWLKKGKKSYFGYKMFVSTTVEEGFIENLSVTPANKSEVAYFKDFVESMKLAPKSRVYADKGSSSEFNRELLKKSKLKDGIMEKAVRGKALTTFQKIKNKLISKKRFIVEQGFGTLKRLLLFDRASYLTRGKVEAQAYRKATCFNLIKALRKCKNITFNRPNVPILA